MKVFLFLSLIFFSNFIVGQHEEKNVEDSVFVKFYPHIGQPDLKFSYVCIEATKQKLGSASYFYTEPKISLKATGKIGLENQKVGKWRYFYKNGNLLGIAHFSKQGNKIGKWKYYKLSGELKKVITIKNDTLGIQKAGLKTKVLLKEIKEPIELESIE